MSEANHTQSTAEAATLPSSDVLGNQLIKALGLPQNCRSITLRLVAGQPALVDVTFFTETPQGEVGELAMKGYQLVAVQGA